MSQTKADPLAIAKERLPGAFSRLFSRLSGKERPLRHIQVEVTSFCPGACMYCPRGILHATWRARHMRDETYAALVPLMLKSRRVHLQGWGEPFAHPRLDEYARLAVLAGCRASTTTCGLVMNETLAGKAVESGMDIVAFSLVGTDEKSNDARVNVPFPRVREAVRTLARAKKSLGSRTPEIHFSYLLLSDRLEAARRIPELMEEWEVPECVVSTLDMPVLPEHLSLAYRPEETEKIARARVLLEDTAARAAEKGLSIRYCLPDRSPGNCREDIAHSCYVDAEGELSPCIYLNVPFREEMFEETFGENAGGRSSDRPGKRTLLTGTRRVCGSILETDPTRIWELPDYVDFRADLAHGAAPESCRSCPKRFERVF